MIRNTTTPQAPPADIHEATAPLGNAGAILETLARSFSTDEPELSMTLEVVLREVYAGMERCEQLDMDTRKALAVAAPATRTDTQPDNAASDSYAEKTGHEEHNPMIGVCPTDTLSNVAGAIGLLGRVNDSEDVDDGALLGRGVILDTMRRALEFEAVRVQHKRRPEADVLREQAEDEETAA